MINKAKKYVVIREACQVKQCEVLKRLENVFEVRTDVGIYLAHEHELFTNEIEGLLYLSKELIQSLQFTQNRIAEITFGKYGGDDAGCCTSQTRGKGDGIPKETILFDQRISQDSTMVRAHIAANG